MATKLEKALRTQSKGTAKKKTELSGTMGINLNGVSTVEVPNRPGFVYVMLNTKEQELIQAFNDKVSAQFGLAVIVVWNTNRYEVIRKDDLRYATWNSSFVPKHGHQHSFNPEHGGGGDVSFIFGKQFAPLSLVPSGSFGAPVAILSSYVQQNSGWHFVPDTPTPNIVNFRPTNNTAKMVLVCFDWGNQTPQIIIGTGSFSASLTGTSDVIPYLPSTTGVNQIPIAGVRLVSGTTAITWQNIYDVRQYFHPIVTGSSSSGGGGGGGGTTGTVSSSKPFAIASSNYSEVTITAGNNATLILDTEVVDASGLISLSSNKATVSQDGWYEVNVLVTVNANLGSPLTANGEIDINVNNTNFFDNTVGSFAVISGKTINYKDFGVNSSIYLSAAGGNQVYVTLSNFTSDTISAYIHEVRIQQL